MVTFIKAFRTRFLQSNMRFPVHVTKTYNITKFIPFVNSNYRYVHDTAHDSDEIVKEICEGDEALEKKLQILMLEVEVMRQDGRLAPDNMQTKHWRHLLSLPSKNQKSNYLKYLWKTEKSKENEKAKKEARRIEYESKPKEETKEFPDDLLYGMGQQTMFLRIRDQSVNNFDNYKALQAMQYGQKIVLDCSYEDKMVWRESLNAAKQVTLVFASNRIHTEPFDIHLCNVNLGGDFMKQLQTNIPPILEPWFPVNIHTESYLDVFPKNNLVYLTPYCHEELTEFDHDAIYIVGCMVDKTNNEKLSLAKAKRDGLKMAKLPIDRYLEWGLGKKSLNINHMVPILQDFKVSGDWNFALKHVPRRKLMQATMSKLQSKYNIRTKIIPNLFNKKKRNIKQSLQDDDRY